MTSCFPSTARKLVNYKQTVQECDFIFDAMIKISFNLIFTAISPNIV